MIYEPSNDLSKKAEMAFADACRGIIARARFNNAPIIICRDGKPIELSPEEAEIEFAKNTSPQEPFDEPTQPSDELD